MGPKLENNILQLTLKRTIDWGLWHQDICSKIMYHQASSALSYMLGMLLAEDPTWKHLQGMLGVMCHQASLALSFTLGMFLVEDPTWKHLQEMLGTLKTSKAAA
ncbi:hypothetical protein lerEdw1_013105 [Lerista edwardsae]|nr:hypothetical protein lerEdw1_013105 [Lerista edwardsae]